MSDILDMLIKKIQLVDKFLAEDINLFAGYLTEDSIEKNDHFLNFGRNQPARCIQRVRFGHALQIV